MGFKENKDKPGTWIAYYSKRHPITKKSISLRRKNLKSKAEARRAEQVLIIKVEDKIRRKIIPDWEMLLSKFETYMSDKGLAKKTIETYTSCLTAHTLKPWSSRLIDTITGDEIRNIIKESVGHRTASHQKNMLKFIRSAFEYALDCGYISRNPTPKMKFRIGSKIKIVLTSEQVKLFLEKAKLLDIEWYPHWCTALYTGMRNGELYALTWDKVSFEKRQILVDCAWNNKDGFKETKSGDDRIVEIAPNLLPLLKELKIKNSDSNFVLPRIDKWDKGEQARELRMFLTGMMLPSIRFHDLRATWATLMLGQGIEPIKIMIMGGWKDLKTMQFYVRKAGVDIKGITNKLELHSPYTKMAKVLTISPK